MSVQGREGPPFMVSLNKDLKERRDQAQKAKSLPDREVVNET